MNYCFLLKNYYYCLLVLLLLLYNSPPVEGLAGALLAHGVGQGNKESCGCEGQTRVEGSGLGHKESCVFSALTLGLAQLIRRGPACFRRSGIWGCEINPKS